MAEKKHKPCQVQCLSLYIRTHRGLTSTWTVNTTMPSFAVIDLPELTVKELKTLQKSRKQQEDLRTKINTICYYRSAVKPRVVLNT